MGRRPLPAGGNLLEWQRDWAHRDSYDAVMKLVKEHSGAYGMGVDYAYNMVHKAAQLTATPHASLALGPLASIPHSECIGDA